ncbi:Vitamin K-dependent gamma-carboxylase [Vulgatibacter incomptus]|uniref:Vitamin K-dependent gamma-carboxylase n=1 Tax=Vulgatibacter incomptus TaxID=1391653 RepID=A0A0K1PES0_9BACT|nr:Vitamin K-dependent gamma-carboxylase [Vulgatibacter incomptus]
MGRLRERLLAPVDASSIAAFRFLFGLIMSVAMIRFIARGWVRTIYVEPTIFFPFEGFGWVRPLPEWGMLLVFGAMATLALGFALGFRPRLCAALFLLGFVYTEVIDKTPYLNHHYLIGLLFLLGACLPIGRGSTVPAWVLWTLRLQLGLVYFFAGVAKLDADWLVRAEPMATWLAARGDLPIIGPLLAQRWMAFAMSWAGAAFDLTIFPLLLWRRSRAFAYVAVAGFHAATGWLFPIGLFPWVMVACTTLFFEPDWPRRLLRRPAPPPDASQAPRSPRLAFALLALHFAVQIALPLRSFAYPGNTSWTEEGFRFAWKVMLIEKQGQVDFEVRVPSTNRAFVVHPSEHLTRFQSRMMSTQPDMILDFAHYLARRYGEELGEAVEVRADGVASLNGRTSQPLVDPEVDLAKVRASLEPSAWIVPLKN